MCGRTALATSPEDLKEAFGLADAPTYTPTYNVPPSLPVLVLRAPRAGAGRQLEPLRWGLVPFWADDAKIGHRMALARTETAISSKAFREATLKRRCLVAVDGFYEWRRTTKKTSQPFFVRRRDGKPFALASIWERWVSRDGEIVESCAILTQPARAPVDGVHDRMPLVVEPEAWDRWLDPGLTAAEQVSALLVPRTPDLVAYEVSTYVNDPRHDDAHCLDAAEPAAQQTLF